MLEGKGQPRTDREVIDLRGKRRPAPRSPPLDRRSPSTGAGLTLPPGRSPAALGGEGRRRQTGAMIGCETESGTAPAALEVEQEILNGFMADPTC